MDVERECQLDTTHTFVSPWGSVLMMTPGIKPDYWMYRVTLYLGQAIVGFPKFGTVGIGFAEEEDWNTNLPYTSTAQEIADHIWHNHKYAQITRPMVEQAIALIQAAIALDKKEAQP